jgi:Glycosyl hydrolases family 28
MTNRRRLLLGFTSLLGARPVMAALSGADLATPLNFGATANGEVKDTKAIQAALDSVHQSGGGTVRFPAGRYLSGLLQLRSNVSIWLDNGATLLMSPDNNDFIPTTADRPALAFRAALLAGEDVESVSIWGEGVIECDRKKRGGPKPISLLRCKRISIRDISILNSPNYTISLLGCENVVIDGIEIRNSWADGIDPDCSRKVRISNCFVESIDDSICLKASGALGEVSATDNVTVSNCVLRTASIHFKCGTESCRDFSNIALSNCTFQGGMGMRHGNPGLAFYTVDGGALSNVTVDNVVMQDVGIPLAIRRGRRDRCKSGVAGVLESIRIANIIARGAKLPSVIAGLPDAPVRDVTIDGFSVAMARTDAVVRELAEIPERLNAYPDPTMFGLLPAHGLYIRHAAEIKLRGMQLRAAAEEQRAAIVMDDVSACRIESLNATQVWLNNVQRSGIYGAVGKPKVRVSGAQSRELQLGADVQVTADADVPKGLL